MTTINFKIKNINVNVEAVDPGFRIGFELSYHTDFLPVHISGRLILTNDRKIISFFNEHQANSSTYYEMDIRPANPQNNNTRTYHGQLYASLTPKAIEHIELVRERQTQKDVKILNE